MSNKQSKDIVAIMYRAYNQACMEAGMLLVGWCQGCKKDWGLRHYILDAPTTEEVVKTSRFLCAGCAKG